MKIYLAGYGHQIEKTSFVKRLEKHWNCLLSYYFFSPGNVDKGMKSRFEYIKGEKAKGCTRPKRRRRAK
jgi:hypothetical protein